MVKVSELYNDKNVVISASRLAELERAEAIMLIMEMNGLDQWEHYDQSYEDYQVYIEEEEKKLAVERDNYDSAFQAQMSLFESRQGSENYYPTMSELADFEYDGC